MSKSADTLSKRYGFVAWFFVITEFVKAEPGKQAAFAGQHDISIVPNEYADGRYALSWPELREIDRAHVIASHARSHIELSILESEVLSRPGRRVSSLFHHLRHPTVDFFRCYIFDVGGDRRLNTAS